VGAVLGVNFEDAAIAKADELGCFGWIQRTSRGTLVGEVRCSKAAGPKMVQWLRRGPEQARVNDLRIKLYEDTKIKLHFAYFKVLEPSRDTCFLDAPHQCSELAYASEPARDDMRTDEQAAV
jgi:acylphosphatase